MLWLKRRMVRVDTVYKRKDQKIKPVNLNKSNNIKLGGYVDWKRRVIEITQI